MDPSTPTNQISSPENVKQSAPASPYKSKSHDADTKEQKKIYPNFGIENNPDMFVCPIEPFLAHYGPCAVDQATLDACMVRMTQEGDPILKCTADGHYSWIDFDLLSDSNAMQEDEAFQPLVAKLIHSVLGGKANNSEFIFTPNTELTGSIPGSTLKIDGCFFDGPCVGAPLLARKIGAPLLIVKKYRQKWINKVVHLQILGACYYILDEDPRRMWIYGLTFENSMVSVWYFSRSHSAKSMAFNWFKDPRILVHILMMFALATPVQLGIDPTVHLGPPRKNRKAVSYVYEVPSDDGKPLFFKTGRSLVSQSFRIFGRITRVWEVIQVTSADGTKEVNGKKVILKDIWLDTSGEHSKTEAENMDAIFEAVDNFVEAGLEAEIKHELEANPNVSRESLLSDTVTVARLTMQFIDRNPRFQAFDDAMKKRLRDNLTNKGYRALFLTKLHAWKGRTSRSIGPQTNRSRNLFHPRPLREDHIEYKVEQEHKESDLSTIRYITTCSTTNHSDDDVREDQTNPVDDSGRRFAPKRQARFIYEEVCTTLRDLDTVGDVVDVLCQTVDALQILFIAGWVHRDISCNNVMAYRSGRNQAWAVKLADLELARTMIDKSRKPGSESPIGTPLFMPVEILTRKYVFHRHIVPTSFGKIEYHLAEELGIDETSKPYQVLSRCLRLPIHKIKLPTNPNWDSDPELNQAVNYNFQHDLESVWWILLWIITYRVHCESSAKEVAQYFERQDNREYLLIAPTHTIHWSLHQSLRGHLGTLIEKLRTEMYHDYVVRPIVGHLELPESYSSIHTLFSTELRRMQARQGPWRNVALERRKKDFEDLDESAVPPAVTGKRGRGDLETGSEAGNRRPILEKQWWNLS